MRTYTMSLDPSEVEMVEFAVWITVCEEDADHKTSCCKLFAFWCCSHHLLAETIPFRHVEVNGYRPSAAVGMC
jgi:hypothetical protein